MSVEEKLLRWKKDLENLKSQIDREEGSLDATYQSLCEFLELPKNSSKEKIIKTAKKKKKELEIRHTELSEELDELVEEIEEDFEAFENESN